MKSSAALGKRHYGLRTDFWNFGDFDGIPINLQLLWWIESSGGRLFRRIEEIGFLPDRVAFVLPRIIYDCGKSLLYSASAVFLQVSGE